MGSGCRAGCWGRFEGPDLTEENGGQIDRGPEAWGGRMGPGF